MPGNHGNPVVNDLVGKTVYKIMDDKEQVVFFCNDGTTYKLYHEQDCCENVQLEDICGDLQDLVDTPILQAEEVSGEDPPGYSYSDTSHTFTFYKFATIKGSVTLRWLGESNGYYSESVDFVELDELRCRK